VRKAKDRGSKWLLEHHGDSVLRLAGITGFNRWRPAPTELVHPLESPDSVLEVFFPGREEPDPVIVEIATYPERRVNDQMARDAMVVLLARDVLPTLLTLVLHPKGNLHITGDHEWACSQSRTRLSLQWQVIELWTLAADDLLATDDIGLIPLVPLAHIDGPPDITLRRCRQRIDEAPKDEQENLLAVAHIMAQMRYTELGLLSIFGGKQMFNDSPIVQEIVQEASLKVRRKTVREMVQQNLETRFGDLPPQIVEMLDAIEDERRLRALGAEAVRCASLDDFRARLVSSSAP
jgi:hypothetical protein